MNQNPENVSIAHRQAYRYYISIPLKPKSQWQNIEDIKPLIRAYYHASQIEDLDAAKAIIAEVCEVIDWVRGFIQIFATHRTLLTIPVRLLTVEESEETEEIKVQAKNQGI